MAIDSRAGSSTHHSIAIVDDEADIRELLALRLGMIPGLHLVGQAASGAEAITLARDLSPDLMTLDLRMPGMGGAEAIPFLRAYAPRMRIIAYSSQFEGVDLSGESRPDAAVSKGTNLGDLIAVIQVLLSESPNDLGNWASGRLPVAVDAVSDAGDGGDRGRRPRG